MIKCVRLKNKKTKNLIFLVLEKSILKVVFKNFKKGTRHARFGKNLEQLKIRQ